MRRLLVFLITGTAVLSCNRYQAVLTLQDQAPMMVYKTRGDFRNLVPVGMDESREQIIAYPHPNDVKNEKGLRYPISLKEGYLLDNIGIGPNVAYLDYTLDEFSELKEVPEMSVLLSHIKEKDPLEAMYRCGSRSDFADPVKELNRWIKSDSLEYKGVKLK